MSNQINRKAVVIIDVDDSHYISFKVNYLHIKDGKWQEYFCGGSDIDWPRFCQWCGMEVEITK